MASSSVIARRYFDALNGHDLDAAVALWRPGAIDHLVGQGDHVAPDGVRALLQGLFAALPDLRFEVLATTTQRERCTVRWRASGTFAGPGRLEGFAPNGARVRFEGCDLLEVADELIAGNTVYVDMRDLARQLGFLPAAGSRAQRRLTALANARSTVTWLLFGAEPEAIAAGVWVIRAGALHRTNAFLIEDGEAATVFDSGTRQMSGAIAAGAVRFGGIRRVILGHADCDHRGGAAALGAAVYCHSLERSAARSPSPFRDYWDLGLLPPAARAVHMQLARRWDGGPVEPVGMLEDGEEVAGFRVLHLPGHAPGLIGLFREEDRLALVSDALYTIDQRSGLPCEPRIGHPAFNLDSERARESLLRLAALSPRAVWPGHGAPLMGEGVSAALERAANGAS
ncbi:MAG TPA: ester cyclase [Solirubrobacteraceae bacterium]|nr:ester cyclase [Solirubrobacteraceae bacterium]